MVATLNSFSQQKEEAVPFAVADTPPMFAKIETQKQFLKNVFNRECREFVNKNFNFLKEIGLSSRQRIYTTFAITKDNTIDGIIVKADNIEMKRVISLFPSVISSVYNEKSKYIMTFTFDADN